MFLYLVYIESYLIVQYTVHQQKRSIDGFNKTSRQDFTIVVLMLFDTGDRTVALLSI